MIQVNRLWNARKSLLIRGFIVYISLFVTHSCIPSIYHRPDPGLQVTAIAPLTKSDIQPPPFFCGPRMYFPSTGYYDAEFQSIRNEEPFANRAGRTDVQACCFWGRGAGQVKGACLYGKLNYLIGARAKEEGRRSLFPTVDVSLFTCIYFFY